VAVWIGKGCVKPLWASARAKGAATPSSVKDMSDYTKFPMTTPCVEVWGRTRPEGKCADE
jgi:hypothetical protein